SPKYKSSKVITMANMNSSDDLLRCPITLELFHDPVLAQDGHTYEREAIEQWIQNHGSSPITRQRLSFEKLYPNRKIIEAMICLASNHVVHGDLACRNVLVFRFDENQPERSVVKITDFGLSRHSQLYSRTPGAARTTLNIVPIRYAAPEVLSSNATSEAYTEKSDVYSMGVLMWEAYSRGSLPWMNIERDDEVIQRVRNGNLLPQPSDCSQPFWSIIIKTWSRSPSDRPTFNELKHFLTAQYYRSGYCLCLS
ncbi:unnamed protein product, partial [Rotaria sordida]